MILMCAIGTWATGKYGKFDLCYWIVCSEVCMLSGQSVLLVCAIGMCAIVMWAIAPCANGTCPSQPITERLVAFNCLIKDGIPIPDKVTRVIPESFLKL